MFSLAKKVAQIARDAGEACLRFYDSGEFWLKSDHSPLTLADIESNRVIAEGLGRISPYKINSEERELGFEERRGEEYLWLIDPLDGTKDFLAKNHQWTINIALLKGGEPVLGVVFAPALGELYLAAKGEGAYFANLSGANLLDSRGAEGLDLVRLDSPLDSAGRDLGSPDSPPRGLAGQDSQGLDSPGRKPTPLIALDSVFHGSEETKNFIAKHGLEAKKLGSSLKFCALARGAADIYPRFNGSKEWDSAAGDAILRECGGVVLGVESKQPLIYNKKDLQNPHFVAFGKAQIGKEIYADFVGA